MLGARSGEPFWNDLSLVREEITEEFCVFIVNVIQFHLTESALFDLLSSSSVSHSTHLPQNGGSSSLKVSSVKSSSGISSFSSMSSLGISTGFLSMNLTTFATTSGETLFSPVWVSHLLILISPSTRMSLPLVR
ncbi:Hypothetical Protein CTN_0057 [Thermotoga neapolitana DSM 4359]|uniref:Uncharacterized protein n=1 Tax=Thermotoga neapolitana (strain ATCC 49049 / DSM 4359 / NBRC 107923 / NS-E) TaxID=309803 RepID=B9KB37_THENN|nr:Hypothetical Protein CTN_0057 [Thermotoga neapolitana DSM 4359]